MEELPENCDQKLNQRQVLYPHQRVWPGYRRGIRIDYLPFARI